MTNRRELADRLEGVRKEHLRLATWNRGKDRPDRVALHHDAAQAITQAARILRAPDPLLEEAVGLLRQFMGLKTTYEQDERDIEAFLSRLDAERKGKA